MTRVAGVTRRRRSAAAEGAPLVSPRSPRRYPARPARPASLAHDPKLPGTPPNLDKCLPALPAANLQMSSSQILNATQRFRLWICGQSQALESGDGNGFGGICDPRDSTLECSKNISTLDIDSV